MEKQIQRQGKESKHIINKIIQKNSHKRRANCVLSTMDEKRSSRRHDTVRTLGIKRLSRMFQEKGRQIVGNICSGIRMASIFFTAILEVKGAKRCFQTSEGKSFSTQNPIPKPTINCVGRINKFLNSQVSKIFTPPLHTFSKKKNKT